LPEAGARPPEFFASEIALRAPGFGVSLSADASRRLAQYLAEVDTWRRRTNLTGPFESGELVVHALESALGQSVISNSIRLIDIGSGAGFPGIPLAIVRPDLSITLLEPRKKRTAFLTHVQRNLPLTNVETLEKRAQALGDATFDVATVRAVGNLAGTIGEARFLNAGGLLVAWATSPAALPEPLAERFTAGSALRVPGSQRRVIAVFQKR
jgi:16S rRNA (guanine527-N7)-methyltransferase